MTDKTQLDRIESKIDRSSLLSWFFGGFALFVAGISFAKGYENPLSLMALFSLGIAILGCVILTIVFIFWIVKTKRI